MEDDSYRVEYVVLQSLACETAVFRIILIRPFISDLPKINFVTSRPTPNLHSTFEP